MERWFYLVGLISVCLLSGGFQVFVFDVGGKTWKSYNWSMVTTLAMFGKYDAELMCQAHSKGARVVLKGRFLPLHCSFSSFPIPLKFEGDIHF